MKYIKYVRSEGYGKEYKSDLFFTCSILELLSRKTNRKKTDLLKIFSRDTFDDKSSKRVMLITAFPVFFISAKRDYDKAHQNYIKNLPDK